MDVNTEITVNVSLTVEFEEKKITLGKLLDILDFTEKDLECELKELTKDDVEEYIYLAINENIEPFDITNELMGIIDNQYYIDYQLKLEMKDKKIKNIFYL